MNAKRLFALSFLLNLVLLALAGYLAVRKPGTPAMANQPSTIGPPLPVAIQSTHDSRPQLASKPFDWSRLESSDYKTYISNLRAIGCPEQTIRDIITADVDSLYSRKSNGLPERELQRLRQEENDVIVSLLGPSPETEGGFARAGLSARDSTSLNAGIQGVAGQGSTVQMTTSQGWISRSSAAGGKVTTPNSPAAWKATQPGSMAWSADSANPAGQNFTAQGGTAQNAPTQGPVNQNGPNPQRDVRVSAPLAFQTVDPNALKVSDEQQQVLAQIRQNFVAALGGDNQDPSTPQYLNRWQNAQRQSDEEMRAMLGGQAFLQYQLQIAHQTPGQ
jgi:hypothetical protein